MYAGCLPYPTRIDIYPPIVLVQFFIVSNVQIQDSEFVSFEKCQPKKGFRLTCRISTSMSTKIEGTGLSIRAGSPPKLPTS